MTLTSAACSYNNQQVPTTIDPLDTDHPITDDTQVSGNTEFTCSVDVTVTTAHAAGAKVPSFLILAEYQGTGVTKAFYIETLAGHPIPDVPVFTGAVLDNPDTEVVEVADKFWQGMWSALLKMT